MAANGEVTINWADGEHKFNLAKIKLVFELQEKCDAGIAEIRKRILEDRWYAQDIRETLRLGLIGGGMTPDQALRLINRYCDDRPAVESVQPAIVVILAYMFGVPGDEVGKKAATERAKEGAPSEKMDDSSVPLSTDSEQLSASARATPTK